MSVNISVPMKNDLMDLDALEELINEHKIQQYLVNETKIFWAMFYTIPTYHNPTGMTLPPGNQLFFSIKRQFPAR